MAFEPMAAVSDYCLPRDLTCPQADAVVFDAGTLQMAHIGSRPQGSWVMGTKQPSFSPSASDSPAVAFYFELTDRLSQQPTEACGTFPATRSIITAACGRPVVSAPATCRASCCLL